MTTGRITARTSLLVPALAMALTFAVVAALLPPAPMPRAWAGDAPEGIGERKAYTFEEQRLNDRLELKVNPATGNLLVKALDLKIAGTGLDLVVERFHNSLSTASSAMGGGWLPGVGHDVHLEVNGSTVSFRAPSGYQVDFEEGTGGTFTTDDHPGIDATLSRETDGTWLT